MSFPICNNSDCVGCGLCESICPKSAISMSISKGFYRPHISNQCVSCGLCIQKCPMNNQSAIVKNDKASVAYASWSKNDMIHKESTSGGLAYTIAFRFISMGGAVVGVWFNSQIQAVEHRLYEDTSDLHFMQGSRYVQSKKHGRIYSVVYEKLMQKDVLFIGVPCEIQAIKSYLIGKKTKHKLYCIDTLCRGGASPFCLNEHINAISHNNKIQDIKFRGGDYDCKLSIWNEKGKRIYSIGQYTDAYFLLFMKHSIFQESCFKCLFAGAERLGDITLGDFWGLDRQIYNCSSIQGINMVLINTDDGKNLINLVQTDIVLYKRPISEAINGNETLSKPTVKPVEYEKLWEQIINSNFHSSIKKIYGIDWRRNMLVGKLRSLKSLL